MAALAWKQIRYLVAGTPTANTARLSINNQALRLVQNVCSQHAADFVKACSSCMLYEQGMHITTAAYIPDAAQSEINI
jgi:hypothetical protein